MGEIKNRDYMFDTFRGLLMWSIPISHFTRVAGHFSQASLSGIIYITINVFVMQAFVFLSGYFSKKPDRARETAFHTFLWPYLLGIPFFYCVRYLILGGANLRLDIPPFALWYLFALFFYRFFLKDYIRIPYIMEISLLVYLFAGQVPFLADKFALGRMVSYFPFFLLGYYCDKDTLARLRSLKKKHCLILGILLTAASCVLAFCVKQLPVGYYLLKSPACDLGITWYWDILGRIIIFCLACGWIVLMLNILPGKMNYVAYVGMNTMPVYILHLIVRYLVKIHSINFGILPDNWVVYYVTIFALAGLCVFVFTTKPVIWAYDFVVEGSYRLFCWILSKIQAGLALLHRPVMAVCRGVIDVIDGADEKEE
jgi:fucose 4-O-acetylase-like acetyltransferase